MDIVLTNAKAFVNNEIVKCGLAINDGNILRVGKEANMPEAGTKIDLEDLLVLPGLIDAHVHLRDEGKAYKEDFCTGTAAAAAGGFATVLDMPNNDPVTMSAETLRNRMKLAEEKILVDVGFYSEFPKNMKEISQIVEEGAIGFKLFMAEQVGGLNIDDDHALTEAFRIAKKLDVPVAAHAEDRTTLKNAEEELKGSNHNDVEAFLEAHSEGVESKAVKRLLHIAKQTRAHVHLCHLSTRNGLESIIGGKKSGLRITCEATPHHLLLSASDLKRIGTLAVTMPPVREAEHIDALWKGIKEGWVDTVGSDHAPHKLEEKENPNVWNVKVGISGLETALPLLLTEVNRGRISIADVVRLMAEKPAEIFKLEGKGSLKEGNRADLTVVDLKRKYKVDASKFHSKAKFSPFDGWNVQGKPVKTFVNGQIVMDDGEIIAEAGSGQVTRRKRL